MGLGGNVGCCGGAGSGPVEVVSAPRAELPLAFDSHFHWDRSLALLRMDKPGTDFNSVCHISPVSRDRQVKVVGAVANFCDPQTYPSPKEVDGLRRQGVRTTVGLHPKAAGNVSPSELRALQVLRPLGRYPLHFGWISLS